MIQRAHTSKAKPRAQDQASSDHAEKLAQTLAELREANERLVLAGVRMQELAEEAQSAKDAAESANKGKDEFLAALSHELRTPLSAILGWVHLLRSTQMTGAAADHAHEVIERNAKLQGRLITDLLNVAQIISGKLRLELALVDLAPIIEASVESLRPVAESKSIAIETHLETGVHQVMADAARIQQVVWNVLSNAIKFSPQGGLIEIRVLQSGAAAVVSIRDSGIGIDPAFLPHIFDRFFQAESGPERAFGGLGLGLAIARRLMDLHGGTVTAQSPGKECGTTFTLTFPTRTARHDRALAEQAADHVSLQDLRVLVVEDEPDARELLATLLNRQGACVTATASAREALAHWDVGAWDVLIADIGLPGVNGYELMREIRLLEGATSAPVAAIALTAFAQPQDQEKALAAGFTLHLTKPFEPDELLRTIAGLARGESRPAGPP
jgi:signal transduction histidine kinase/ActR/RegA family two-component response regulator